MLFHIFKFILIFLLTFVIIYSSFTIAYLLISSFIKKIRPPKVSPIIATHEAGHLITAWFFTNTTKIKEVIASDKEGHVLFSYAAPLSSDKDQYLDFLWGRAVISLGGIAAEIIKNGKMRSGASKSDLEDCRSLISQICQLSNNKYIPPSFSFSNEKKINFRKIFKSPLTDVEYELMLSAYHGAKYLINVNKLKHEELSLALEKNGSLPIAKIPLFLGDRISVQILSNFRVGFAHPGMKQERKQNEI